MLRHPMKKTGLEETGQLQTLVTFSPLFLLLLQINVKNDRFTLELMTKVNKVIKSTVDDMQQCNN